MAGGAIDFDEVALPEILDLSGVEGEHSCVSVFLVCSKKARGRGVVNG
jgi:hypothetical protein